MTLNILQAHAQAVLDLLDADDTTPPLVVLNGHVPTGQLPPYALLYFAFRTPSGVDEPQKVSLESTSDVLNTTAYCHCVGGDLFAALAVAGRVRAALRGVTPTVAGRVCAPIGHVDGSPTRRDEETGADYFDQVDVWAYTSLPG